MVIRAVRTLRAACGGGRPQGLPVRQEIPPSPVLPPLRRGRFLARNESKGRRDGRGQRALPRRGRSRRAQAGPLRRSQLVADPGRSSSQRRASEAVAELVATERPALIPVADGIGRKFRVRCQRGGAVLFRAGLRLIAEAEGCAVVPPAARIVGGAVEYLIVDVRVFETHAYELQKVLR